MPEIATFAVAPAAMAPVLPFSVVLPVVRRVTEAVAPVLPRFLTTTVKLTDEPAAGLAGLDAMLSTCRSGLGASETTTLVGLL